MSLRIAFVGPPQSGKTTLAKLVEEEFGCKRFAFADEVKAEIYWLLARYRVALRQGGSHLEDFFVSNAMAFSGPLALGSLPLPPMPMSLTADKQTAVDWFDGNKAFLRPFIRWYATEYKRNTIDPEYWIKRLYPFVRYHDNLVNDDCRFLNEAEWLAHNGFTFIQVCPSVVLENPNYEHQSDSEQLKVIKAYCTMTFVNTFTPSHANEDLKRTLSFQFKATGLIPDDGH